MARHRDQLELTLAQRSDKHPIFQYRNVLFEAAGWASEKSRKACIRPYLQGKIWTAPEKYGLSSQKNGRSQEQNRCGAKVSKSDRRRRKPIMARRRRSYDFRRLPNAELRIFLSLVRRKSGILALRNRTSFALQIRSNV